MATTEGERGMEKDIRVIPSKQTRLMMVLAIAAWVCAERYLGGIQFADWFEAMKWLFGIYAASEVGAKGSHAIMNR